MSELLSITLPDGSVRSVPRGTTPGEVAAAVERSDRVQENRRALGVWLEHAYRDPAAPGGWTPYDELTAQDKKKLTDALLVVQEPLSAISAKITN